MSRRLPIARRGSAPAGRAAARARRRRPWPAPRSPARRAAAARSPPARRRPRPSAGSRRRCAGRSPGRAAAPAALPPRGAQTSETEPQSSGSTSSAAPWCTDCGSSGAVEAARIGDLAASCPHAAIASASRSAALRVTTSRRRSRAGLASASRTACSPNSQTVAGRLRAAPAPARSPRPVSCPCRRSPPPPRRRASHAAPGGCKRGPRFRC